MERVVNIIGMGASKGSVPDTGENWGINFAFKTNRLDKLFFMESLMDWLPQKDERYPPFNYTFDKFLEQNPDCELISQTNDFVKNVSTGKKLREIQAFPLNEACELIPGGYFSSTVAYIIVYTMVELQAKENILDGLITISNSEKDETIKKDLVSKIDNLQEEIKNFRPVDRIRLYGIEAWSGGDANEYNYQRPCMEFWLAFAQGRGIKVEIPYYMIHTNNCNQNFYGYFSFDAKHKNYKVNPQTAVI